MQTWLVVIGFLATDFCLIQLVGWAANRWWQKGLPNREPFLGLLKAGFTFPDSAVSWHETDKIGTIIRLIGEVNGYAVEISTNYRPGLWTNPFYLIRVFFSTDNLALSDLENRHQHNLENSQYIRWDDTICFAYSHAEKKWLVNNYGPPSGAGMLISINRLITELIKLELRSISYSDAINQWQKLQV